MNNARRGQDKITAVDAQQAHARTVLPEADRTHKPPVLKKSDYLSSVHGSH
jgi:hypothetical protein